MCRTRTCGLHETYVRPHPLISYRISYLDVFCVVRPTEILEEDVFICESRYNEADKSIRKHKGLKVSLCYVTLPLSELTPPTVIRCFN